MNSCPRYTILAGTSVETCKDDGSLNWREYTMRADRGFANYRTYTGRGRNSVLTFGADGWLIKVKRKDVIHNA